MNKKKIVTSIIAITLITFTAFTGCNKSTDDTTTNSDTATSQEDNNNTEVDNTTSNLDINTFYGEWYISEVMDTGHVSANAQEDIDNIVGQTVKFSETSISYRGDTFTNPSYVESTMDDDNFNTMYSLTASNLGISTDSVEKIDIENYDGMDELGSEESDSTVLGRSYFIKDENTLILYFAGDFFELTRVN